MSKDHVTRFVCRSRGVWTALASVRLSPLVFKCRYSLNPASLLPLLWPAAGNFAFFVRRGKCHTVMNVSEQFIDTSRSLKIPPVQPVMTLNSRDSGPRPTLLELPNDLPLHHHQQRTDGELGAKNFVFLALRFRVTDDHLSNYSSNSLAQRSQHHNGSSKPS